MARTLDPHLVIFYMYVLRSKKDKDFYIGSTNNLQRRFKEHNAGDVQSTKPRGSFSLLYYEAYSAEEDARKREHQLKLRGRAFAQLRRRISTSLRQDED
ncbi:MAG: GIY-YIG nuclease family protein [Candidatus Paceibacterota bacterium]